MSESPFKWDGSNLGVITDINIRNKFVIGSQEFWEVSISGYKVKCMIRRIKDCTTCIIDEIKPLFGLFKNGSHHLKYGIYVYMLTRCRVTDSGEITLEQTLDKYKDNITAEMVYQIQSIYIFRDMLKLGKTNDSNVLVRKSKDTVYPVSHNEPPIKLEKMLQISSSSKIPEGVYKKWFRNEMYGKIDNINTILLNMLNVVSQDKITIILTSLKEKMLGVAERVGPGKYCHIADVICQILTGRLCSGLENR